MKGLLDTCTFLWIVTGSKELSLAAAKAFADPGNEIFLSVGALGQAFSWKAAHAGLS